MDEIHPLRAWRQKQEPKTLTQGELGDMLGIGASHVSQIESGLKGCSLELALKIAEKTGIPIESLTRREAA